MRLFIHIVSSKVYRHSPTQGENPTTEEGSVHIIEYYLENGLFSLRWLLVPLYVGLGLLLILVYFFRELLHLFAGAATGEEVDLILGALTLVDLTLVGSLIVMVMLGENQFAWQG